MPEELRRLMLRYIKIMQTLPPEVRGDEVERTMVLEDDETRATIELVLAEAQKAKAEIYAFLDAARAQARA